MDFKARLYVNVIAVGLPVFMSEVESALANIEVCYPSEQTLGISVSPATETGK